MAKYTGLLTSDLRGKTGGISWSHNGSGNFARRTNIPRDPNSPIQSSKRQLMSNIAKHWRIIPRINYSGWITLAGEVPFIDKLHHTYYLTGFQMYMYLNLAMVNAKLNPIDVAPDVAGNTIPLVWAPTFDVSTAPGTLDISMSNTAPIADPAIIIVEACGSISKGITRPKGFKFIGKYDSHFTSGDSIYSDYLKIFNQPVITDAIYWFRSWVTNAYYGWHFPKVLSYAIGTI